RLGQGGMASVYLCAAAGPIGFNKLLVLKVLKGDLSEDDDFLAMFVNEARLAARLNHANVVQTYEVGFDQGKHFLAMDYLDGQPMHALLRKATREGMPLDLHVRILADTLAGLHYAHTLKDFDGTPFNVVHRDVSPQNVFVTYDGQVKVVDFGIAKATGAASTTQAGVFKGKLTYIAPEQAGGAPVDLRADLFSVGVMLWEALACKRFSFGETKTEALARRMSGNEPRIREVVPDADLQLADICDRAIAHAPEDRFPTAVAFRDALESFLDRYRRQVGSRDLSELMNNLFAEERERIRAIIDEQMKRLLRETAQALPVPNIERSQDLLDHTPTTIDGMRRAEALAPPNSLTGAESTPATGSNSQGTLVGANLSAPPPGNGKNRRLLISLGGLAIASVLAIVLVLILTQSAGSKVAPSAPASTSPASSAAPASSIQLAITFGPPPATAKLDGVTLTQSPFVAQVPRDGSMHQVEVVSAGFVTQTAMLSYDQDVKVSIVLKKEVAPTRPTGRVPSTAPPTPPVAGPPPAATGSGKQPLKIDEEDPYK
ncbi:MAG: serine/threonine protein kinase, partial [Deltaproteobacteria bacterium]|nr:serine/threonine protein kinase [Deltaproteobacteria bacterium]